MTRLIRFALPAVLALGAQLPGAAFAQAGPQPVPTNPSAPASALVYDSAFAGYRSDKEQTAIGWKESNARVTQPLPGGDEHAAHAGHDMGGMKHGGDKPNDEPAPPPAKKDPHHGHQHKE